MFGNIAKIAAMASQGPAALAPVMVEKLPGLARVLVVQRLTAEIASSAALLSKGCGDAIGQSLVTTADVAEVNMGALAASVERLLAISDRLRAVPEVITIDTIAQAYGARVGS